MLILFVDDVFIDACCDEISTFSPDSLKSWFEVGESDVVETFLGTSVESKAYKVKLHNAPVIERLLRHFKMEFCNPVATSFTLRMDLRMTGARPVSDTIPYKELLGSPLNLTITVRQPFS